MAIYIPPRPTSQPSVKAGPIGPGAGVLQTEFPLSIILGRSQQDKMRQAYKIGMEVPWVRKAESVIASRLSTVPFLLEDPEDADIDDDYPKPVAVEAYDLLTKPQGNLDVGQKLSRSQLWRLTSRHLGLCGNAFWLNDEMNTYGIARSWIYIRPDRMSPNEDANGNLRSWQIDKTQTKPGTEVSLEQVNHFMLEPPDHGHFGPGLVETWLLRSRITQQLDEQLSQVLGAGGRLTGIMSPKSGSIEPGSDTAVQMERDWRTIVEQPNAATRLQIVYAPVEFTKTTLTMDELQVVELMKLMRDDGLGFWGVPPATAGFPAPAGLNSGGTRVFDEAALWQGPVHDRLVIFSEMIQDNTLDRYEPLLGWAPQLIINEPTFDDEAPKYDLLEKSISLAMTDDERRDLIGKAPLPDGKGNLIRLPSNIQEVSDTTEPVVKVLPAPVPQITAGEAPSDAASNAAGETTQGKARSDGLRTSLVAIRTRLQANLTPKLRAELKGFLDAQKADIARRLAENATHVAQNPRDTSVWFDKAKWDRELRAALGGPLTAVAQTVDGHIATVLTPSKAGPLDAIERMLLRGAARIAKINDTTRDAVASLLADIIRVGGTIQDAVTSLGSLSAFDEYRAELIARTELMDAYNGAALGAYGDAGITQVEAIDGDEDQECIDRVAGNPYSVEEADAIEDHPNGTLDWIPVIGSYEPVPAKAVLEVRPDLTPKMAYAMELYLERERAEDMRRVTAAEERANKASLDIATRDDQIAQLSQQIIQLARAAVMPRDQPITINVPEQPVTVNVAASAPVVVPASEVTVNIPEGPKKITKRVQRDKAGLITGSTEDWS